MSNEFKLVPVEPTEEMLTAAWKALSGKSRNIFHALKDAIAAAPQPPALGGEPESKLIKLAAELASRRPIRSLQDLCDRQKSVSTAKLIEDVEMCGDFLAAIAVDIRHCVEANRAHVAAQQTEIERLKDQLSEVTTYRDNAVKKIERLRNELTGNEKEHDQLKARNAELEENYRLAIAEMEAVIATGLLSCTQHEDLEADACASVKRFWHFHAAKGSNDEAGGETV